MKPAILLGHYKNDFNQGAIVRTAEALGINFVYIVGNDDISKGSEGADKHVVVLKFKDYHAFLEWVRNNKHHLVVIENFDGDCWDTTHPLIGKERCFSLENVKEYPTNPVFVSGHENKGVDTILLNNADLIISIPQGNGYIKCLNTSVAMGLVLYDWFIKTRRD